MKLIILQSVFIWFMLIKNVILKTSIASTDDFIVNFNENFRRHFDNEEKLQKFKKHLIKKMKYRIKERFLKNSILMELLQVKDREKLVESVKSKKEKIKNLKKKKILMQKKVSNNRNHTNSFIKNKTYEIINPSINFEEVNFISMKKETQNVNEISKIKGKPSFRIDFKLQNSSIVMQKKNLVANNDSKNPKNHSTGEPNFNENNNYEHNGLNKLQETSKNNDQNPKESHDHKHLISKPIEITKQDFVAHKNPKSDLLVTNRLFFASEMESESKANFPYSNINSTASFNSSFSDSYHLNDNETKKSQGKRRKANTNLDIFDWSFGDINSNKRVTKFYINLESKCNIFINDTIYYDKDDYTSNFIDHLILHNNFDSIEPRSIYSNDVLINYFIYNKKLNMFTVNFENEKHHNYSIVYEYFANNLIKLQQNKKDFYSNNINHNEKNVNEFLWKFYNENTNSKNLSLEVEFYFTIDKSFMNENVEFNNKMLMYKTLIENKETLVFKWNGTLMPYEVKVFESVFPMVFENCQTMTVNFTMILIGAFFVIFIVLILYLLFSSIAKDLN